MYTPDNIAIDDPAGFASFALGEDAQRVEDPSVIAQAWDKLATATNLPKAIDNFRTALQLCGVCSENLTTECGNKLAGFERKA